PHRRRHRSQQPDRQAVGVAAVTVLALLARWVPSLELGPVVAAPGEALVALLSLLGRWAGPLVDSATALGRLLGALVAEAGVLLPAVLIGLLLVGALSFKLLHDLLQSDRSLTYADSI
ncbi:MAG TPA: hypothetical protein VHQ65_15810, partial [Thermoanaerobaculia bacterium]|nr:hypothetical protein [Thermoanaerobaculia bacterium]